MPAARDAEIARLRGLIRSVPDFPRPGVVFRDATPLFADPAALRGAVDLLAERLAAEGPVDVVFGAEARGFILGPALAIRLGAGFVPARRQGKLPVATARAAYELEYGAAELHVHTDAIAPGARVVVHDDLIATGGTAAALGEIVGRLGGEVVAYGFLIELTALAGRDRLTAPTHALIDF
ncbi:MAG TPA: adenine phosphoribosyltransferase [Solirubrobacterales bacterium]|nr:adenine phosphoribosyltransferase [Solirubrobacterales bacterium]